MNQYEKSELSKTERKTIKEIVKTGILRRHQEWQNEIAAIINSPYTEGNNAFDRSMEITQRARDFHKEAMQMEEFYRNSQLDIAIVALLREGYLTKADLTELPLDRTETLLAKAGIHTESTNSPF